MQHAQRSAGPSGTGSQLRTSGVSSNVTQAPASTTNQQAAASSAPPPTAASIANGSLIFHQSTSNTSLANQQHAQHTRQPISGVGGGNVALGPQTSQQQHHNKTSQQSSIAHLRDFGKGFHLKTTMSPTTATMNTVSTAQQQQNAPAPPRQNAWTARQQAKQQQQQQQVSPPPSKNGRPAT
jgi:hypothetical protein